MANIIASTTTNSLFICLLFCIWNASADPAAAAGFLRALHRWPCPLHTGRHWGWGWGWCFPPPPTHRAEAGNWAFPHPVIPWKPSFHQKTGIINGGISWPFFHPGLPHKLIPAHLWKLALVHPSIPVGHWKPDFHLLGTAWPFPAAGFPHLWIHRGVWPFPHPPDAAAPKLAVAPGSDPAPAPAPAPAPEPAVPPPP